MAGTGKAAILTPRFKGIENFLRKIAFNLGNTPSQTEVKIISCIPIDVTDLQNKIVDLERELDERDRDRDRSSEEEPQPRRSTAAHPAIGAPTLTLASTTTHNNHTLDVPETFKPISSSPSLHAEPTSRASLSAIDSGPTRMPKSSTASIDERQDLVPNFIDAHHFIKKKRMMPKLRMMDKKKKSKTQMVYYTQMIYPEKVEKEAAHRSKQRALQAEDLSHTYLANVTERQYRPKPINEEPSTSSGFSWPVCRDEPANGGPRPHLDSDVCSCCHGLFHNVDTSNDADSAIDNHHNYNVYYDSSLYDVVPVKETPSRIIFKSDVYQSRQNNTYQNRQNDVYLEMERDFRLNKPNKPRVQFEQQFTTKCCTVNTPFRPNPKQRCNKKTTNKSSLKEQVIRAMQKRKHDYNLRTAELCCSGCVDCGKVYTKIKNLQPHVVVSSSTPPRASTPQLPINPPPPLSPRPLLKNAECLTMKFETQPLISRSVQLEPSPAPPPPPPPVPLDTKTEITLNQIKSILHAVLTEVKTSAQKQTIVEDKCTKDAVVQNGPSQSNIAANSSYMNSYLYSPRYSFCPHGASYSGQTGAGSQRLYPPGSGVPPLCLFRQDSKTTPHASFAPPGPSPCAAATKCVQNYPLFIHTTGRQCTCCYRSVPAQPNLPHTCPLPAVPANNDVNRNSSRNQETNNLIKEIYKSLALNMNYPQKDTSSNYTDLRSSVNASNKKFVFKIEPKSKPKMVASEILHKSEKPTFINKALRQQFGTTEASYRSEINTGTTVSTAVTDSTGPRGDGVRSLLSAKKELLSTGSETAHEREPAPLNAREYSQPAEKRDHRYSQKSDRDYSPSERHDRDYSPSERHVRGYPPSVHHDRGYTPSNARDRRYPDKRDQRYSPRGDRDQGSTQQTLTGSISDDDTVTPSIDNSEESETTVINIEKKEKRGIFSKMKKLFTSRRRRRKKEEESSEVEQEPTSDSDDYETVYSEITNRSGKRTKQHRPPTPPPAPRSRRRPHSKVSFSRYHRHEASTPRSPRLRRDPPVIAQWQRRSPYMEQEYRRHWNEELAFHQGTTPRYSSERPRTRLRREFDYARYTTPPARSPHNPYWREYEARPVLVPPPRSPLPPVRPPGTVQQPYRPPGTVQQPFYPQQYNSVQDQVSKGGQTDQAVKIIPQEEKHLYIPQSYKPTAKGISWLKKLNKPNFNCGVQWKNFFLEG